MREGERGHVVWCDLEVAVLRIRSEGPWDTKMVRTCEEPDPGRPVVEVLVCREDDAVFDHPSTYREKIIRRGSYRGHHFGPPGRLKIIDPTTIAISHPDPGTLIWSLVVKHVLTVFASRAGLLHLKAAALAHRGTAFLFMGRGGSGKTEMVRTLCDHGARLMANTHVLLGPGTVHGVRSNVRVRQGAGEIHVPLEGPGGFPVHEGPLPLGAVFWVSYRTDGQTVLERMPAHVARANMRYFAESINNWELKEDLADHAGSDPYAFAELVEGIDARLDELCSGSPVYYAHLDIRRDEVRSAVMDVMETAAVGSVGSSPMPRAAARTP